MVGPIAPGEMISIRNWFTLYKAGFDTVGRVTITKIQLEYTDGTTEIGTYDYSTTKKFEDIIDCSFDNIF